MSMYSCEVLTLQVEDCNCGLIEHDLYNAIYPPPTSSGISLRPLI
jgi:hypothetical protein